MQLKVADLKTPLFIWNYPLQEVHKILKQHFFAKSQYLPRISPGVSDASICSWAMEDEGQTRFNVDTTSKSFMHRLSRTDLESWLFRVLQTQNLHFEELVDSLYFFSFVVGVISCVYSTSSLSSCHSVTSVKDRSVLVVTWLG